MCTHASVEHAVDEPRHSAIADAVESQFDHRALTDRHVDTILQCVVRAVWCVVCGEEDANSQGVYRVAIDCKATKT